MAYIISSILKNSLEQRSFLSTTDRIEDYWKQCMLTPQDYSRGALFDETTRDLMSKIEFLHGGEEYDSKYPEGIPSSIQIDLADGTTHDSGFVMFPGGHARNTDVNLKEILQHKFKLLGGIGLNSEELPRFLNNLNNLDEMGNDELQDIYDCNIKFDEKSIDE